MSKVSWGWTIVPYLPRLIARCSKSQQWSIARSCVHRDKHISRWQHGSKTEDVSPFDGRHLHRRYTNGHHRTCEVIPSTLRPNHDVLIVSGVARILHGRRPSGIPSNNIISSVLYSPGSQLVGLCSIPSKYCGISGTIALLLPLSLRYCHCSHKPSSQARAVSLVLKLTESI